MLGTFASAAPSAGTFSYQGRLTVSDAPADGQFDFQFRLYDSLSGGDMVGPANDLATVQVNDGLFNVLLDFGEDAFDKSARWLQIGVRPGASVDPYTTLAPRQPITPAPHAIYAGTTDSLGGSLASADRTGEIITLNNSELQAHDAGGNTRGAFGIGSSGEGAFGLWGPNGWLNVDVSSDAADSNRGYVGVADDRGEVQTALGVFDTGEGGVIAWGPNDNINAAITSLDGEPNNGYLAVADRSGDTQAGIYVTGDGEGAFASWGPNGNVNVDISSTLENSNHGYIGVADNVGDAQAQMTVFRGGEGAFTTWGPNGSLNVDISALGSDSNKGYVGVADRGGNTRAGIYVDGDGDGIVFGDYKFFVVDHPRDAQKEIVYVSLEGPEAGIFCRGKVQLQNGRAIVALPEHFTAMANPDTVTVQLTPVSFDSFGVGYQVLPNGQIEIRELNGGKGGYKVAYHAQAVRAGSETHQPVMQKGALRQSLTPASRAIGIQSEETQRKPVKKAIQSFRKPKGEKK